MSETTTVCGKCDGKKVLTWTRIANGVCFMCGGAGVLTVTEAELAAARLPRAEVIAALKVRLDRLAVAVASDDYEGWRQVGGWDFGKLVAHAPEDVATRALAALARLYPYANLEVEMWHTNREIAAERAVLVAKVRKVVKSVRKVA